MTAPNISPDRWEQLRAKLDADGRLPPKELADLMRWEAHQCYQGIGTLRELSQQSGRQEFALYADVLDFAVRRRFSLEMKYYDELPPVPPRKLTAENIHTAWAMSKKGLVKEVAGLLDVRPDTLSKHLSKHPEQRFKKKTG